MKKEITVCRDCEIPLIWTFTWAYSEYFCINCGGHWGMMGAGERVDLTPELKAQNKVIQKIWKAIDFNLICRGQYKITNCKKCDEPGCRSHTQHINKTEKRKDKLATSMLKKMRGAWN